MTLILQVMPFFCFVACTYFCFRQRAENKALSNFLGSFNTGDNSDADDWESIKKLSLELRRIFNVDQPSFSRLKMSSRPFLRETTLDLLDYREGLCGEGARVLIVILNHLGFDATRVTLFTKWLHPSHTIVSVLIEGEEVLIDTINSQARFNDYLNSFAVSTAAFNIMTHIDDVDQRREKKMLLREEDVRHSPLTEKYILYSYDAIPLTKILSKLGLKLRTINLKRPPLFLSRLAEKPYSIKAGVWAFLCILCFIINAVQT